MFTLIKREIKDNMPLFTIAFIVSAIAVITLASQAAYSVSHRLFVLNRTIINIFTFLMSWLAIPCVILGSTQMSGDRDKKVSSFLSTLATTRRQIMLARIISGLLWIIILLLPFAVTFAIVRYIWPQVISMEVRFFITLLCITGLIHLVCYCIGLRMSWQQNKVLRIVYTIVPIPIVLSIFIIRGLNIEIAIILLLFASAMMVQTWQKFMSTSL
ncbi:hypothetical protein ACFL3G_01570 [Planctomycetota bacterium]